MVSSRLQLQADLEGQQEIFALQEIALITSTNQLTNSHFTLNYISKIEFCLCLSQTEKGPAPLTEAKLTSHLEGLWHETQA